MIAVLWELSCGRRRFSYYLSVRTAPGKVAETAVHHGYAQNRSRPDHNKLDIMTLALRKVNANAVLAAFLVFVQGAALAQSVPTAIFTDPPPDKTHPAKMSVVHIPTHGLLINGVVYQASGAGLHPTI